MSSNNDATPVRQVKQYESDEAIAKALQQAYDDEVAARRFQEEASVEDEFDAATRARNDQLSERTVKRMS